MKVRKVYHPPVMDVVSIDREMTLVMASITDPGGGPRGAGASPAPPTSNNLNNSSFKKNPFNGTK